MCVRQIVTWCTNKLGTSCSCDSTRRRSYKHFIVIGVRCIKTSSSYGYLCLGVFGLFDLTLINPFKIKNRRSYFLQY